jgi:hypothetical protein
VAATPGALFGADLTIADLCATGLVRMILGGQSMHGPFGQSDAALH